MRQQKALGLECCSCAPEPHLYPIGSSLKLCPSIHRVQRELKPPLIGFLGFLISNPFPVVLIKKLKVISLYIFIYLFFN